MQTTLQCQQQGRLRQQHQESATRISEVYQRHLGDIGAADKAHADDQPRRTDILGGAVRTPYPPTVRGADQTVFVKVVGKQL